MSGVGAMRVAWSRSWRETRMREMQMGESTQRRPASALCIWGQGAVLDMLEANGKVGANPGPYGGKMPD